MKKNIRLCLSLFVLLLLDCGPTTKKYSVSDMLDPTHTAALSFSGPYLELLDDGLPGVMADSFGETRTGSRNGLMYVWLRNNLRYPRRILLSCNLSLIGEENTEVVELAPGEERVVMLWPTIDSEKLYELQTTRTAKATFKMTSEDAPPFVETFDIKIEPFQRFHWFAQNQDNESVDLRPYIFRFVTPDDKRGEVQKLIREAASYVNGGNFIQTDDPVEIWEQMEAIYIALQKRGFVYNHLAARFFDNAQRVRLPAESLQQNHGNCIDTSLVFASAFEAIGLDTFLVFTSNHAQVGVRYPNSERVILETTNLQQDSFAEAIKAGGLSHDKNKSDPAYAFIAATAARRIGILPAGL